MNPKPEVSLALWHDEWHLFPNEAAISFDQQPQSQTVQVGGSACFCCTVTGPQTPAYQWYFNGVPMLGQTSQSLLLPSVVSRRRGQLHRAGDGRRADRGLGPCHPDGYPAAECSADYFPAPGPVGARGRDRFLWRPGAGQRHAELWWSKDGAYLSDGGRITGSSSSTLQIANVQTSDAGNYRVRVSNQAGSVDSSYAGLTVLTAPSGMALIPAGQLHDGQLHGPERGMVR